VSQQSLYRKYRPNTFDTVVGQKHITRTLKNAVTTGSFAHAYLFVGPRGTGKTTTARILAAALVCDNTAAGEPDGSCEQCLQVIEGRHPDVIELDAASQTGVDNVREEIINNMHLVTVHGKSKVYIIDEVHMLSKGAFNALLKTLEEPPPNVIFILCTTDPQKVLSTVRSRCQEFEFRPISVDDITERLTYIAGAENIEAEPQALELIARHADGGMRDAITLFQSMRDYAQGAIRVVDVEERMGGVSSEELTQIMFVLARRDTPACFVWVAQQVEHGADLVEVTRALLDYARDAYVVSVLGAEAGGINRSVDETQKLAEIAAQFSGPAAFERLLDLLFDLSDKLRWSTEPRILIELTLARACNSQGETSFEALLERIERLEKGTGTTATPAPAAAATSRGDDGRTPPSTQKAAVETTPTQAAAHNSTAQAPAEVAASEAHKPQTVAALSSDEATLNRQWRAILEQIQSIDPPSQAVFSIARLQLKGDSQVLAVVFAAGDSYRYKLASKPEAKKVVEQAVATVFGRELPVQIELAAQSVDVAAQAQAAPAPAPAAAPTPAPAPSYEAPAYEPVPDQSPEPALDSSPAPASPAAAASDEAAAVPQGAPEIPVMQEPTPQREAYADAPLSLDALKSELNAVVKDSYSA